MGRIKLYEDFDIQEEFDEKDYIDDVFTYTTKEIAYIMSQNIDINDDTDEILSKLDLKEPFVIMLPTGEKLSWDDFVSTYHFSDIMNNINQERQENE